MVLVPVSFLTGATVNGWLILEVPTIKRPISEKKGWPTVLISLFEVTTSEPCKENFLSEPSKAPLILNSIVL